jgi:hypothetical protein
MIAGKRRVVLLNKADLADPAASQALLRRSSGGANCISGGGGGGGGGGAVGSQQAPPVLLTCVHQQKSVKQVRAVREGPHVPLDGYNAARWCASAGCRVGL